MSDTQAAAKVEKNKKINKMTLAEIDKAIEKTQQNMGSLNSRYGLELQKQREVLTSKKK
jgi:hypothetical protein